MDARPRVEVDREKVEQFCQCMRELLEEKAGQGVEADQTGQPAILEEVCGQPKETPPGPPLIAPKEVVGKCTFILTGDTETDKELGKWLRGELGPVEPKIKFTRGFDDDALPSLASEMVRLRTVIEKEVPELQQEILIDYREDSRNLELLGYNDHYHGSVWALRITPNYTVQNQREIAEYVRRNEGAIVDFVRKLNLRKRRGFRVAFYETHPGLQHEGYTYGNLPMHPEDG